MRRALGLLILAVLAPLAELPAQKGPVHAPEVVEFTAVDYGWKGPAEIPSGWVTFRMPNAGREHHIMFLYRLPDGATWEDWSRARETGESPAWLDDLVLVGGPGLVAPGETAQTTVDLEPGEYVLSCPLETRNGVSHVRKGMERPLTVTEEPSGASEPEADLTLTLRGTEFGIDGTPHAGKNTIRGHFEEQPADVHDVHLARLDDEATVDQLVPWFDGVPRAPAPALFLGGVEQMPAGSTAYFTVDLEPGRYAWICHEHADRGMVEVFTVE